MKVVVLEQSSELAELIGLYLSSLSAVEVIAHHQSDEVLGLLGDPQVQVILMNRRFTIAGMDTVYRHCCEKRPEVQRVIIGEEKAPAGEYLLNSTNLVHEIKEMTKAAFWRKLAGGPTQMPLPLSPYLVYRLGICPADLFLKLGDNNWVKLFHQGTQFGDVEKAKFEAKGVKTFYILADDIKNVMGHFADLLGSLQIKTDASLVADAGEFIWHSLRENGFREEIQVVAEMAIKQPLTLLQADPTLKEYVEHIFRPEHGWLVRHNLVLTHVACGLASRLGWGSEATYFKIATAAFLHDMALPRHDQDEEIWLMSAQGEKIHDGLDPESKAFLQHPFEGAQIIRRHTSIPPDTDKIILEHHELPEGGGFPRGLTASQISPMGALFIFSHAICTILLHEGPPSAGAWNCCWRGWIKTAGSRAILRRSGRAWSRPSSSPEGGAVSLFQTPANT